MFDGDIFVSHCSRLIFRLDQGFVQVCSDVGFSPADLYEAFECLLNGTFEEVRLNVHFLYQF